MLPSSFRAWILVVLFACSAAAMAQRPPEVALAGVPPFGMRVNVHPGFLLLMSVTYPISEVAYRGDNGTYVPSKAYIGYFNPAKCYSYSGANRNITNGYFVIAADAAADRSCDGTTFSGNFLNWVSMASLDILRYSLTGGDRVVDTPEQTVLQRSFLRTDMYADPSYFPRRSITGNVNKVSPFTGSTLYIVSCENKLLFSNSAGSAGANCASKGGGKNADVWTGTEKSFGEYLARVQVCDAADAASRPDFCVAYASGSKPVGVLQRNASRMRLAVMSYLLDNNSSRYGGVLRAPMRYIGPRDFSGPDLVEQVNTKSEWNAATGVFTNNPDPDADGSGDSGALNYINHFGRNGQYKQSDPLSELYYEGLRYLQGQQPTAAAAQNLTPAVRDGFPVLQKWDDPLRDGCQRNYIVTVADVNSNYDHYVPGHNYNVSGGDGPRAKDQATKNWPELDVSVPTRQVGEMEADAARFFHNPNPNTSLLKGATLDRAATGYLGYGSYYISGLAYWANTNDIRLDQRRTRVTTYAVDVDEDGDGTLAGGARSIKPRDSQLYLAAKYGGFDDSNNDGNPFATLDGQGNTTYNNSEWDPDGKGAPKTYFLVSQANAMVDAFKTIFSQYSAYVGSMAGSSTSAVAARLTSDGAWLFRAWFASERWAGGLQKIRLSLAADGLSIVPAASPTWDAGDLLDRQPWATRAIFTSSIDTNKKFVTAEFKWDKLSADQQALLNTAPNGKADSAGSERLNYLRGDRSKEVNQPKGSYRFRGRLLGDIINSNVVYAGVPSGRGAGAEYLKFVDLYKARPAAVYAGANDGMLHAFSADDGRELFAYVPAMLMGRLPALTDPAYAHAPYVDGGIVVDDVQIGTDWRTVLAAALGGGAQGVFALDVSDPGKFADVGGALLEFSDKNDRFMGNISSAPQLARFRIDDGKGKPAYETFLVVQSGYNNYADDNNSDASGQGALFLLSLKKKPQEDWQQNVNYYRILLPAGDTTQKNAFGPPALVRDGQGAVTHAYLGDLQGRLWRLDFSGGKPWANALPSTTPLFVAQDGKDIPQAQPITMRPSVVLAPGGGYVVVFGTGKFVENSDSQPASFVQQSLYAVYDDLQAPGPTRSQLALRTADTTAKYSATVAGVDFTYGRGAADKRGWVLDLPDSLKDGERSVSNFVVQDGYVYLNSILPGTLSCGLGTSRSYVLDVLGGLPTAGSTTGLLYRSGMLGTPNVLALGSSTVGERNPVGQRMVSRRNFIISTGAGGIQAGAGQGTPAAINLPAGRFSWRELVNWQAIKAGLRKAAGSSP